MPGEYERIAEIEDPFQLLRVATERLAEAQQEVTELSRLRRRLIQDLHAQGMSYAQIAEKAGLSRGRIHQIRHTGPSPEAAFLGVGTVTIATPLRHDQVKDRPVLSLDDMATGQTLEQLVRGFDMQVDPAHVTVDGRVDLNRPNLIVVCGPAMSEAMRSAYATDPVLRWENPEPGLWLLTDTRTGESYRSGQEMDPQLPMDMAYIGRLPRPDGKGSFLAIAGIHPQGSRGVAHLLTQEIASLWGQVRTDRFSALVRTEYDPNTHEPTRTELITPLYRHDQD
ncbi:RNA polymerase subunit sigma-24 [Nocardiopsis sp. CNR-923]|uniref:sigma-70 family RNA polymerase sigma factor n=1 Tax=Nocardiopsis sp. CNR-923 TaxID=1904965 RepID=UPI000962B161|nr:sigma-70 family RNA polymerase sigma factor [Nocardiopsis sp. CNR-923]OLT24465.1 RNA polymerase subunit sigma-24 [Nocardiopsis sp. CNR-923]